MAKHNGKIIVTAVFFSMIFSTLASAGTQESDYFRERAQNINAWIEHKEAELVAADKALAASSFPRNAQELATRKAAMNDNSKLRMSYLEAQGVMNDLIWTANAYGNLSVDTLAKKKEELSAGLAAAQAGVAQNGGSLADLKAKEALALKDMQAKVRASHGVRGNSDVANARRALESIRVQIAKVNGFQGRAEKIQARLEALELMTDDSKYDNLENIEEITRNRYIQEISDAQAKAQAQADSEARKHPAPFDYKANTLQSLRNEQKTRDATHDYKVREILWKLEQQKNKN